MSRALTSASVVTALAALFLSLSCSGRKPDPSALRPHRASKGGYSGWIENRIRKVTLDLDKAGFRPRSLVVAQGEDVRILATSRDTAHELRIEGYGVNVRLQPGQTEAILFDADFPGTFPIVCSCGEHGPVIDGVLLVKPRGLILRWLARYGLWALFGLLMFGIAGIPMPDEVMLSFAGGLASTGNYNMGYLSTILVAFLGASCGITFSYVLGRTAGLGVVHRYGRLLHITSERLNRVHNWYAHGKGRWALLFCIFLPVFRHITAIVAGTSKMPLWEFALCAYSGVLLWVSTFVTLGFLAADYWMRMSQKVHYTLLIGSLVIGAAVLVWYIHRNRREHLRHLEAQAAESRQDKPHEIT